MTKCVMFIYTYIYTERERERERERVRGRKIMVKERKRKRWGGIKSIETEVILTKSETACHITCLQQQVFH